MEATFLTGDRVEKTIKSLIDEHEELYWAVAWGTHMPLARKLVSASNKFRAVTFGLAFAQTDPRLVEALVEVDNCYVVKRFPGGTYHPKLYGFRTGARAAAVIGSANFTRGGLDKNCEAAVLITGSCHDSVLAEALTFAARSAALGERITADLAVQYRRVCRMAAQKPGPSRDPFAGVPQASLAGLSSSLVDMTWAEYVRAVRGGAHHNVEQSLGLLRTAQAWLSAVPSFGDLDTKHRKAISGVIGDRERKADEDLDQDWGWFGSMWGAGDFRNRIAENDPFLARALDSIPQRGEVKKDHYNRFADMFVRAFDASQRKGGVPTASRLLAMKRPDVFLCISGPNRTEAAKQMAFSESSLSLETYWDQVVEVVRASTWYNADKPRNRDGQLWECRAAMLDAIFYRPK